MSTGTLCFIPCCNSKTPTHSVVGSQSSWYEETSGIDYQRLLRGREAMKSSLKLGSPHTPALFLYTGEFYRVLDKGKIMNKIAMGDLRLSIISAGYGIVDALERIQDYNAKMEGSVARKWQDNDLSGLIGDYILKSSPETIFGFFTGEEKWSASNSKYRYFFTSGIRSALKAGLKVSAAGCFYRSEGQWPNPILPVLGMCFMNAVSSNFSEDFISQAETKGIRYPQYPSILIKFRRFS